jgi:hypothetical protein
MKRKIFATITAFVMILSMTAGFSAFATDVNTTETQSISVTDAKTKAAEKIVETANKVIVKLVEVAQSQQDPDIDKLVALTNLISKNAINAAANLGVEVVCEYVAYEINGQIVLIDPLRIIYR